MVMTVVTQTRAPDYTKSKVKVQVSRDKLNQWEFLTLLSLPLIVNRQLKMKAE